MTRCLKSICITAVFSLGLFPSASAQSIAGTYLLQKDSDGRSPKKQAKVTITFKGGITGFVSMSAVQPGETVTDSGTFKVMGNLITIKFKEMEWEANRQPFTLQGCTLTLPFLALGGSGGPGTSTWIKQGCNAGGGSGGGATTSFNPNINTGRNGGKGVGSGSGAGGTSNSASNNKQNDNSSDPRSQSDQDFERNNPNRKELTPDRKKSASCSECTYVPCIKQLIKHKQEMISKVYTPLAKEFGKFYFANSVANPVETIDGGKTSTDDFEYLLKVHASFTRKEDELASTAEVARYCGFENSSGLEASTHAFNCEMNFDALSRLEAAVPCHEIYDYAVEHEQEHYAKCDARKEAGTNRSALLLTPYGKANEEIANYKTEIGKLNDLLRRAEEKCRYTCRCTGEKFATSVECQANCKIGLFCAFSAANSCMAPDKPRKSPN